MKRMEKVDPITYIQLMLVRQSALFSGAGLFLLVLAILPGSPLAGSQIVQGGILLLVALLMTGIYLHLRSESTVPTLVLALLIAIYWVTGAAELSINGLSLFSLSFFLGACITAGLFFSIIGGVLTTVLSFFMLVVAQFFIADNTLLELPLQLIDWLTFAFAIFSIFIPITSYIEYANAILFSQQQLSKQLQHARETIEEEVLLQTTKQNITNEVNRSISTFLDPNRLIDDVVNQIQQAFNFYHVQAYLLDPVTEELVIAGGTGEAGTSLVISEHRIPIGKGYVGLAALEQRSIFAPDVIENDQWLENPYLPDTQAEAAVPIFHNQNLIGILDVQHDNKDQFLESDVQILEVVANQLGIALNNVSIFQDIEKRADINSALNRFGLDLQLSSDVDNIIKRTGKMVEKLFQPETVTVKIASERLKTQGEMQQKERIHDLS